MLIRSRMGVSADGFVATPGGLPALLALPGFVPGEPAGPSRTGRPNSSTRWREHRGARPDPGPPGPPQAGARR
jgi:hypothetical protein